MSPVATAEASETAGRIRTDKVKCGKFFVPDAVEWDGLLEMVRDHVAAGKLVAPLTFDELSAEAALLAGRGGLDGSYIEFLIVMINNEIWRDVVATIPFARRTLMLPPCLRSTENCKAEFDEYGLLCEQCGACNIGALSTEAEKLGYAVLVAEGTSIVGQLIENGAVDAVIGVSCMPSLERTFPYMANMAVPGLAIPLLKEGCEDTSVLVQLVREFMNLEAGKNVDPFIDLGALIEDVRTWFSEDEIRRVLGAGTSRTESIGMEWLLRDGKRFRPFLVAAVYAALKGGRIDRMPDFVRCLAIAVECIHKASLIYDDIQDDDDRRYGEETVHESVGVPIALTAGLYLNGHGYRLIAECGAAAPQTVEMLQLATRGHCDLCLGQGAELCWMQQPVPLAPDEVLEIFRYKTAPSFDVVVRLGALAGGATPEEHAVLTEYSSELGVAYQIQDDLADFTEHGDVDDIKSGRPSIVIALALQAAQGAAKEEIAEVWQRGGTAGANNIRQIIKDLGVEAQTREMLELYRSRALSALRPLKNRNLKILLHRIAGKIISRK